VKNTLIDAGPLIALFDKDDKYHKGVRAFLKSYEGNLITTWPAVTEAIHMLSFSVQAQIDCLTWIKRRGLAVFDLTSDHIERLIELIEKYADLPMDLADASLCVASEVLRSADIATIDSDYEVYRPTGVPSFNNVLRNYL
jgi:hypothetical protein